MQTVTLTTDWGNLSQEKIRWMGWGQKNKHIFDFQHITSELAPADLLQAQHFVHGFLTHWPSGTIHIVMTDAEAAKVKQLVWLSFDDQWLLLPNHILWHFFYKPGATLSLAAEYQGATDNLVNLMIRALENENVQKGNIEALPSLPIPNQLSRVPQPVEVEGRLHGQVMWIDSFGNLETNIRKEHAETHQFGERYRIILRKDSRVGLTLRYHDAPMAEITAFFNSRGWLEIGLNGEHAARLLGMQRGMTIMLEKI